MRVLMAAAQVQCHGFLGVWPGLLWVQLPSSVGPPRTEGDPWSGVASSSRFPVSDGFLPVGTCVLWFYVPGDDRRQQPSAPVQVTARGLPSVPRAMGGPVHPPHPCWAHLLQLWVSLQGHPDSGQGARSPSSGGGGQVCRGARALLLQQEREGGSLLYRLLTLQP